MQSRHAGRYSTRERSLSRAQRAHSRFQHVPAARLQNRGERRPHLHSAAEWRMQSHSGRELFILSYHFEIFLSFSKPHAFQRHRRRLRSRLHQVQV